MLPRYYYCCLSQVGVQREEKVKILSNMAECHLRVGDPEKALKATSEALEVDVACLKALLRRARAWRALDNDVACAKDLADLRELLGGTLPRDAAILERDCKKALADRRKQQDAAIQGNLAAAFNTGLGFQEAKTTTEEDLPAAVDHVEEPSRPQALGFGDLPTGYSL
jgi:hypothetical protein